MFASGQDCYLIIEQVMRVVQKATIATIVLVLLRDSSCTKEAKFEVRHRVLVVVKGKGYDILNSSYPSNHCKH